MFTHKSDGAIGFSDLSSPADIRQGKWFCNEVIVADAGQAKVKSGVLWITFLNWYLEKEPYRPQSHLRQMAHPEQQRSRTGQGPKNQRESDPPLLLCPRRVQN